MKIIGHRGAAGMALENSLESIQQALLAGVDAVEIDARLTSDNTFVLSHDASTKRTSTVNHEIRDVTSGTMSKVTLRNGEPLPTLKQALKICGSTKVIIDLKSSGWAEQLVSFLGDYKNKDISIIALDHNELATFKKLMPDIDAYAVQKFHHATEIFDTFKLATKAGFKGVDMNFWLLNPLTYWVARRNKLEVIVYTVNHFWIARFLQKLFPNVIFTTDYPSRLQSLRTGENTGHKK